MNHEVSLRDELKHSERLRITEIFCSIQGEAQHAGWPTAFIRLTGCPLRCQYCDTAYAFHGGNWVSIESILDQVAQFDVEHVCVTGGEPLAQKNVVNLIEHLCEKGFKVSLETSGAMSIARIDSRCIKVVDIKTPGSGEMQKNRLDNFAYMTPEDQFKFVICHREDYEWALELLRLHQLPQICTVWFSASHDQLSHRQLAEWIIEDSVPVRFQMQLHKLLWDSEPGR